jgi:uncharacterized membrane protein YjjP (DUF1212 family)
MQLAVAVQVVVSAEATAWAVMAHSMGVPPRCLTQTLVAVVVVLINTIPQL